MMLVWLWDVVNFASIFVRVKLIETALEVI